ncbi:MAG: hypothetical protein BIFFINMI_00663 [Phycisphaerae bacterium]|nr:hypothetical protein [Phycisphaerae bacterium]
MFWRPNEPPLDGHEAYVAVAFVPSDWRARVLHMLGMGVVIVGPLWLAVWAFQRGRSRAVVAALTAGAALASVGFSTRADLWDRKPENLTVGLWAASIVPQGEGVSAYGRVDGAVNFYFGRDLPEVLETRKHLSNVLDPDEAARRWAAQVNPADPPLWVIGVREDVAELGELGYALWPGQDATSAPMTSRCCSATIRQPQPSQPAIRDRPPASFESPVPSRRPAARVARWQALARRGGGR